LECILYFKRKLYFLLVSSTPLMDRKMLRPFLRSARAALRSRRSLREDRRGASLVEFAIGLPVLMLIGLGMLKFGVAMNHYVMLTNASSSGATALALARGTTTPYTAATTAITSAAPSLTAGSITTTVRVNGTACTTNSGCAALLTAGATAQVTTTYPCDLSVLGVNYKANCTLSAQSAQMVQ
jgi:Flp pilus assembly protein TadG